MEQQALSGMAGSNFGNSYLAEKKFEVMLDNTSKKLMAEITKIKESLTSLQEEVNQLRRGSSQAAATASFPQTISSSSSESARPRQNEINPKDVAVEKMFYFGNKR